VLKQSPKALVCGQLLLPPHLRVVVGKVRNLTLSDRNLIRIMLAFAAVNYERVLVFGGRLMLMQKYGDYLEVGYACGRVINKITQPRFLF
jgi:hypothetical protein